MPQRGLFEKKHCTEIQITTDHQRSQFKESDSLYVKYTCDKSKNYKTLYYLELVVTFTSFL